MAEYSGFKNANKIGKVVLERIDLKTPLDERNMQYIIIYYYYFRLYNLEADHHMDYPYIKSRSGALYHKNHMPWDW